MLVEVTICEIQKHCPVFARHRMLPGTDEIAQATVDELAHFRFRVYGQSINAQEAVDRVGSFEHIELPVWIRPLIPFCIRE